MSVCMYVCENVHMYVYVHLYIYNIHICAHILSVSGCSRLPKVPCHGGQTKHFDYDSTLNPCQSLVRIVNTQRGEWINGGGWMGRVLVAE